MSHLIVRDRNFLLMVAGMRDRPIALITGVTGQDGPFLAQILSNEGYDIYGISRYTFLDLSLNKGKKVIMKKSDYSKNSLKNIISSLCPDVIFNLTGQSYVSKSWDLLNETIYSQGVIVANLLDTVSELNKNIKFLNICSSEIFDSSYPQPFDETSPCNPYNPYGCAQLLGKNLVEVYRSKKNLWAVNSILFAHESVRRSPNFLFPRIINGATAIYENKINYLEIGNLSVVRDWAYAPNIMEGVFKQSKLDEPQDFCFCSGEGFSVEQIINKAFNNLGLDYKSYIKVNKELVRNYEPSSIIGSYKRLKKFLIGSQNIMV